MYKKTSTNQTLSHKKAPNAVMKHEIKEQALESQFKIRHIYNESKAEIHNLTKYQYNVCIMTLALSHCSQSKAMQCEIFGSLT